MHNYCVHLFSYYVLLSDTVISPDFFSPQQHPGDPVFFFKDAEFDDLVAIIEFIYSGQVNVDQTRFTSFLAVAEMLKIKGLAKDACPDQADHQVCGRWLYAVCLVRMS